MRHPDCDICQRLWLAYTEAMNYHIRIVGQQQMAALRRDFETVSTLEEQVQQLEAVRDAARDAVRDHESEAHARAAAAAGIVEVTRE